ncbi:unnamed protein product [Danaus chrysippus]|uniref:(African queen) hypothetical protein n=1 Tax=Danaus chrysippus TaxID=151541 RepID=A0A8J2QXA4_9NEOP|nr:unnamed protein product [Danaus chrysippus]
MSDSNLKQGVRIELGRIPDDVFLNESPKYGDLYETYNWTRIRRNLCVKKAEIMDVISKNVIVNKIDHINNTTKKSKIRINEYFPVENIISSAWSKDGLPDDDIYYNMNIDLILKKVTLENKWSNTKLKTVEIQFGLKNPGYVEIEPGETITTKLTARKTTALYKITYKAQLTGSIIANFAHEYGKYHFYAPKISDIMKANRLNNEIITTEVIEIKCYTDPRMDVFDKKTGKRMIIKALVLGASITVGIFVFHVAVVPLIFKYSKTFRRHLIFANFAQWPLNVNYDNPTESGIEGARNFYIEYESKVDKCPMKIGVWHILPKSSYERIKGSFERGDNEELNRAMDEDIINSKQPVVLYCHGNSNSRAAYHRIQLYKFFQKMDFHTIAFDYRGYGDSTNVMPTEDGVVEDSLIVFDWLNTTLEPAKERPPVFVWGHSLGTGISSHLLGNLKELSKNILEKAEPLKLPNGLILESPFNNLADEVNHHPLAILVSWLPYFKEMFVSPFIGCPCHSFRSDDHLSRQRSLPVLVLHARDDLVVPHIVGEKLYQSIVKSRANGGATIKLHSYDKNQSLGHKWICTAKDLPQVVGAILVTGASLTASVLVLQVAVLPLLFRYSKSVQRKMVFSNCSVWHIVPCSLFRELFVVHDYLSIDQRLLNELRRTKNTVVLYCHGNSNHRASPHRLQMYKVFQDLNFHVITFDYRGYGDSTRVRPTESGVVEDALQVYSWIINNIQKNEQPMVVLWGHSLGTAIAANLVSNLSTLCNSRGVCLPPPHALVLEAPFNNLLDEIECHPFSKLVSWLPYFRGSFVKPFMSSEHTFTTDCYLSRVPSMPILMLHSRGDRIVPYDLACKLHECISASRSTGGAPLVFHSFDRGHNDLCEAPELPAVVESFLELVKKK